MANPYESPKAPSEPPNNSVKPYLACPHCGGPAMSHWKKAFVGPAWRLKCRSCGKGVGISWWSSLAAFPLVLVVGGFMLGAVFLEYQMSPQRFNNHVQRLGPIGLMLATALPTGLLGGAAAAFCQVKWGKLVKR